MEAAMRPEESKCNEASPHPRLATFSVGGRVVSAGIPGPRPLRLVPRFSGFETQVAHFLNRDNLAVSSGERHETAYVNHAGGSGALPPLFFSALPRRELLPSTTLAPPCPGNCPSSRGLQAQHEERATVSAPAVLQNLGILGLSPLGTHQAPTE